MRAQCHALDAAGDGQGTLTRISGYTIALTQPQPPAGTAALLARYVTDCEFRYDQAVIMQNHGVISIRLSLTRGNETVSLYHEVHVSNIP